MTLVLKSWKRIKLVNSEEKIFQNWFLIMNRMPMIVLDEYLVKIKSFIRKDYIKFGRLNALLFEQLLRRKTMSKI